MIVIQDILIYYVWVSSNLVSDSVNPNKRWKSMAGIRFLCVFLFTGYSVGCSNKQLYEAAQQNQRQTCELLVHDDERAECMEGADMSYDEYESRRRANNERL
jgi:hypothetical protein